MPGYDFDVVRRDVTAAALYFSNFHFADRAVDYFRLDDPPSLVMHFWSLSVEEQFYVVWPLVLALVCWLFPRNWRWAGIAIIAVIVTLSFAANILLVHSNQPLAFFHTGTRCWQLGAGALLAALDPTRLRGPGKAISGLGWTGLAAIALSFVIYDVNMNYPGAWAVLPTVGAIAVIASATVSGAAPNPILLSRPLQWIGARSYSWYLWHWPVIVFLEARFPEAGQFASGAALVLSLAIAALVYKLIEDPVRKQQLWPASPGPTLAGAAASLAIIVGGGFATAQALAKFSSGPSEAILEHLKIARTDHGANYRDKCHLPYDATAQPECSYGQKGAAKRVVLFGDSHAAQWFAPLEVAAQAQGWQLDAWTKSSCPSIDISVWYRPRKALFAECDVWRSTILKVLTGSDKPDLVIIANLANYLGWIADRRTGQKLDKIQAGEAIETGLRATIGTLEKADIKVVVLRDTPVAFKSFGRCLELNGGAACDRPRTQAFQGAQLEASALAGHSDRVRVFDLTEHICNEATCPVMKDGKVIYIDSHHLTSSFAKSLSPQFEDILRWAEQ